MFDYRLAALLGRTVAEMRSSLTQREYLGWQKYWAQEPWGSWRDNMHTALLGREIAMLRNVRSPKLDDFMLKRPEDRVRGNMRGLFSQLKTIAVRQSELKQ